MLHSGGSSAREKKKTSSNTYVLLSVAGLGVAHVGGVSSLGVLSQKLDSVLT